MPYRSGGRGKRHRHRMEAVPARPDLPQPRMERFAVQRVPGVGESGRDILERSQSAANKERLRAQTEQAVALGIFGAPTFVARAGLFWGNDRLEDAIAWCKQVSPPGSLTCSG